jgi:hypothetical protein
MEPRILTAANLEKTMGAFYVNYTLRGPVQSAVVDALQGFRAVVTPARERSVVVAEERSDSQADEVIEEMASVLSRKLSCAVWTVLVHDDDILKYWVHRSGAIEDKYDSAPDYFSTDSSEEIRGPIGGRASVLCELFASNMEEQLENVLRASSDVYVFETDRHMALLSTLGAANTAIAFGFRDYLAGFLPEGVSKDEIVETH